LSRFGRRRAQRAGDGYARAGQSAFVSADVSPFLTPLSMTARTNAVRRTALVVLSVVAALALIAAPVAAQNPPPPTTAAPPDAPPTVLAGQRAWVAVGGRIPFQLQVQGPGTSAPGLRVSVTAHQAVSSRTGYETAIRGESLGSTLGHVDLPLDLFPAGAGGI